MEKFISAHFCHQGDICYAGNHLLIDIWDGKNLESVQIVEQAFKHAIELCGATLLHMHFHHFGPECGVSGVAVLQESHISIHSWPELGYAALDIFLCGNLDPFKAVAAFKEAFQSDNVMLTEMKRGIVS